MRLVPELNLEFLLNVIADRVAAKVEARQITPGPGAGKRLLTVEESAVYLGRTKTSVQHLVAGGRLPTVRADRRVLLDIRDLDSWIEQNKQAGAI